MTVFVLFSQQRSGMGALASFVTEHPKIINLAEVLNPNDLEHKDNFFSFWLQNDPAAMIRASRSPSELFIDYLNSLEANYGDTDILLDIKLNSIRNVLSYWEELPGFTEAGMPWLLHIFRSRGYPALYLHRDNHLHRFISSKFADMTGVYRSNDPNSISRGKVEANIDEMRDFVVKAEWNHECFMRYFERFSPRLYLNYTEVFVGNVLAAEAKISLAKFFKFQLRLDAEPYYIKLQTTKLDKVVVNYEKVREELTRLGREQYLEGYITSPMPSLTMS